MRPERELNQWPFALLDDAEPTGPHRSGLYLHLESLGLPSTSGTIYLRNIQQKIPAGSSTSCLCFNAKLKCHVSQKPFLISTTDRKNHSFEDPPVLLVCNLCSTTLCYEHLTENKSTSIHTCTTVFIHTRCSRMLFLQVGFYFISYSSLHSYYWDL